MKIISSSFADFIHRVEQLIGNPLQTEAWLDNEAVCRRLSISKRTLQTLRDTGKIPFSMVGHKCYYKESDITEALKAQTEWMHYGRECIRIPKPEDQQKLIELYRKSGAKTKSDYLRGQLLNQSFKVITEDKSSEPYLRELSSILTKLRVIGVSYNEAVKMLNSYHLVKTAQRMTHQLERYSAAIIRLQVQAIQLTMAFDNREKIPNPL